MLNLIFWVSGYFVLSFIIASVMYRHIMKLETRSTSDFLIALLLWPLYLVIIVPLAVLASIASLVKKGFDKWTHLLDK